MGMYVHVFTVLKISVLLSHVIAWDRCSKTNDSVVCVQCTGNGDEHKCPEKCTEDIGLCAKSCHARCNNSKCEFDTKRHLICSGGCVDPFTGPYCDEFCFDRCNRCTRDNKRCLECESGYYGNRCDHICENCVLNKCTANGTCVHACEPGFFGPWCTEHCGNCKCKVGEALDVTEEHTESNPQFDNKRDEFEKTEDVSCGCDEVNGTCADGCQDGYYGFLCENRCPDMCIRCEAISGQCQVCSAGWYGMNCSGRCSTCNMCRLKDGACLDSNPDIEKLFMDYVWVGVPCIVFVMVVITVGVFIYKSLATASNKDNKDHMDTSVDSEHLYATVKGRDRQNSLSKSCDINRTRSLKVEGLIYADLDLPPSSREFRKEEITPYVEIDFSQMPGPPFPEKKCAL